MRTSLVSLRQLACQRQQNRCVYCGLPMCVSDPRAFCSLYGLSQRQAGQLKATGEHLIPYRDGGKANASNIAAAHWICNQRRARRRVVPSAPAFKKYVENKVARGRWHCPEVIAALASEPTSLL